MTLAVLSTHPIQYQAPVYRYLQTQLQIPVTAIYGSDFSISGYHDREFGTHFAWDSDLLSGYSSVFLSHNGDGHATSYETTSAQGAKKALYACKPRAILLLGYSTAFHRQAFLAARQLRVPLLLRAETTDHALKRGQLKQWIRDSALRIFYRQFDKLLYIGKHSYDHYLRLGCHAKQLVFSPYCVDTSPFHLATDVFTPKHEVRSRYNIAFDKIVLLFSGKLVHRKGPDLLIEAFLQLPDAIRQRLALVFLGEGNMRQELEARVKYYQDVYFMGFQNQSQLSQFYHMADLLVVPSRGEETWGLVVNEALHHGVPCVVSDQVGCGPDLIHPGLTGEIFASNSFSALSTALQRALTLVNDPSTAQQCQQIVNNYSVENAAAGIALAYHQLALSHSKETF